MFVPFQEAITSTIETLKKDVKTVKYQNDVIERVVLVSFLSSLTYFTPFCSVSIVAFEQVNVSRFANV